MSTKISKISFCSLLLVFSMGCAQSELSVVRSLAEESGKALVTSDFSKVVELTHPKVVKLVGGKDKMVATLENGMSEMKRDGFEFAAFSVGTPTEIAKIGNRRFTIVPYVLKTKAPSGSLVTDSFLLGVNELPETRWTFVDGRNLNESMLKTLFPEAAGKLKLPKVSPHVFQQD